LQRQNNNGVKEKMLQNTPKLCPHCQQIFQCNAADVSSCQCNGITLGDAAKGFIATNYSDCLCRNCLLAIKDDNNTMTLEQRIQDSETRIFKAVFPSTTNHYDTLFGGTAMQLMDEVAFIAATRFTRKKVVTVSSDKIDFKKPIPGGTIIELIGRVTYIGTTSLKVKVDIFIEEMYSNVREKAITGTFTFVAVDENKRPVSISA